MKVLLTGGTGFMGPATARALSDAGHTVRCLVRSTSNRSSLVESGVPLEWAEGDVSTPGSLPAALEGVEAVVHLAGATKTLRIEEYYRINTDGTRHLAEAAVDAGVKRFVLCSSLSAAGPITGARPLLEEDPPAPVSHYGRSKLGGEEAARRFADRTSVTIVRPPIVYGPRDRDFFEVFKMTARGFALSPGILVSKRYSMIHVEDAGRAMALALDRGQAVRAGSHGGEGVYYVTDGGVYTWEDLLRRVARSMGRNTVVLPIPDVLSWGVGLYGEVAARVTGKAQIVSVDKMREAVVDGWACSTERARRELGYEPRYPLDEGLADAARWYREQRWI